ncbi:c-type cytochrome [Pacificispira sp.]|uniref:c-type cytochrome n=1 Tax=Pacificispira sp. TaxID=2888761 RepID=UPI003BA89B0D
MKKPILVGLAAAALGAVAVGTLVVWPIGFATEEIELSGDVERGAYLARASGCIACHTDFAGGGAPLAGGAPLKTAFGDYYPPNITTDLDHGIGAWTVDDFAKAVRQGIDRDGQPYFPTFPYPFYSDFSDQDIADLWAAFQTVPPVPESAPDHAVSFPFSQRWGMKAWRAAFLTDPSTEPVEGKTDRWNRGRWLVEGAAHCGACHTPRNFAGARVSTSAFAGNDELPDNNKAPSILASDLVTEGWTVSKLAYALRTGVTPSGDAFGGSMGEVVAYGTRFLSQSDLEAMAVYLLGEPKDLDTARN